MYQWQWKESVRKSARHCGSLCQYSSFCDVSHFKNNKFLSWEELRLSLLLYCDDYEICNPLGTSRKKHKVLLGVGWYSIWLKVYTIINLLGFVQGTMAWTIIKGFENL